MILRWLLKQLLKLYYRRTKFLAFSVDCGEDLGFVVESCTPNQDIPRYGTRYDHITEMTQEDAMNLMLTNNLTRSYSYDPVTRKFFATYTLKTSSPNTNHNEHERSDA